MAVDRGGLQYRIAVRDDFSAATSQFIASIRQAKDEFAAFRAEVQKGRGVSSVVASAARATQRAAKATTSSIRDQERALERSLRVARSLESELRSVERRRAAAGAADRRQAVASIRAEQQRLRAIQATEQARERQSQRILAALRRDEAAFQRQQLRQIQELAARRADAERQRIQLARAAAAERARLERLDPARQGQARAEDLVRARATAQEAIASLRRLGREDLITNQLRRQAGELRSSARSANSLLFTFRRLVGVLAAFQIARALVGGFRELITLGISFNDQIRQAEIGIAGLIVALSDVRDEQGRSVDLAQEFARAQTVARRQVALLRQDALLTTATFEQLLDTFQIAIAPGFAAGLNLDEIRKLSVSISQAATAIGVPQNQLAEEIRSLLSGTIQARTTRIATALQITNADIRRLRESGELFDFLEERFRALGVAAERAARQTLTGIGALVRDALGVILGGAAEPLFRELLQLGNEVFDQVLTIRDAAGDVRPRPEAVAAFRALFDGLRDGVRAARELGRELGFRGLQNLLGAIGTGLNVALQAAIGFAGSLGRALSTVVGIVRQLAGLFGEAGTNVGNLARFIGRAAADFFILRTAARLFGINLTKALSPSQIRATGTALRNFIATPLGKGGVIGIALVGVLKGFELILEEIFDINLTLGETAKLLGLGLLGQIQKAITELKVLGVQVGGFFKSLFASDEEQEVIDRFVAAAEAAIRAAGEAAQAEIDRQINAIITPPAPELPDEGAADAAKRAEAFGSIISNVESIVAQASGTLAELDEDLRQLGAEFDAAAQKTGAAGFAGKIEDALAEAAAQTQIKSREINAAIAEVVRGIEEGSRAIALAPDRFEAIRRAAATPAGPAQDRALEALQLTAEEGQLVSLLRNEAILREKLGELEGLSLQVARLKIGLAAREDLPALQDQLELLRQQAAGEQALADAVDRRLGARRLAAIEARNELTEFLAASAQRIRKLEEEAEKARQIAERPVTGFDSKEAEERDKAARASAAELLVLLRERLRLETDIAKAQELRLEIAEKEARLAAEGSFTAGIRAGFVALADELPTLFDAAKNIVQGIVNSFVSAVSQTVRDIIDPRVEVDLRERLGNLLLDIGEQILQQAISALIQQAIQFFVLRQAQEAALAAQRKAQEAALAAQRIATETAIAAIRAGTGAGGAAAGGLVTSAGFAEGGTVPRVPGRNRIDRVPSLIARARGYARGGAPFGRAPGISPKDTVPAWLQPGEFVIRKAVVDSLGAGFFRAVNAGEFIAPARAPSGESAIGMIDGGRVTRREPARALRGSDSPVQIVPAVVTTEREMDRLQAGGKNASLRFMRENAGTIRGILGI